MYTCLRWDPSESAGVGDNDRVNSLYNLSLFMPGSNVRQQAMLCRLYSELLTSDVSSVIHSSYLLVLGIQVTRICRECAVHMYVNDVILLYTLTGPKGALVSLVYSCVL